MDWVEQKTRTTRGQDDGLQSKHSTKESERRRRKQQQQEQEVNSTFREKRELAGLVNGNDCNDDGNDDDYEDEDSHDENMDDRPGAIAIPGRSRNTNTNDNDNGIGENNENDNDSDNDEHAGGTETIAGDDISALTPLTIERPSNFTYNGNNHTASSLPISAIAAEVVESNRNIINPENISDIVAEVLRQQGILAPTRVTTETNNNVNVDIEGGPKATTQREEGEIPFDSKTAIVTIAEGSASASTPQEAIVVEQKRICGIPQVWFIIGIIIVALVLALSISMAKIFGKSKPPAPTFPMVSITRDKELSGLEKGDFFGHYVEFSRDASSIVIGASGTSPYVQVFRKGVSTWDRTGQTIESPSGGGSFGNRVDINGDGTIIVIGAHTYNGVSIQDERDSPAWNCTKDSPCANIGRVQVYQFNGVDAWVQLGNDLVGSQASDRFGWDVAISDDGMTIVVGARGEGSSRKKFLAGYVKVYRYNEMTKYWDLLGATLNAEMDKDEFGRSVAIASTGNRVAIGATQAGTKDQGRVYVYDYADPDGNNNYKWLQAGQVLNGTVESAWQGTSVDLSADGNFLAIGADGYDVDGKKNNVGTVTVYRYVDCLSSSSSPTAESCPMWVQYGDPVFGEVAGDQFSAGQISLSNDGQMLAVGSSGHNAFAGKAYLFRYYDDVGDQGNATWSLVATIEGEEVKDQLGFSVNVGGDGSYFATGVPRLERNLTGYVLIYSVESN